MMYFPFSHRATQLSTPWKEMKTRRPFIRSGILCPPWKDREKGRGAGGAGFGWGMGIALSFFVPDYAKIVFWPVHEIFEAADAAGISREDLFRTLSYFDVKNFAPRIHCPVIMAFGLQDPTCPPHTNFSIYNNLGTKDKQFVCIPTCGHAMWLEPAWPPLRDAFLNR